MISVVKSQRQLMLKGTHLLEGPKGRETELVLERRDAIIKSQNNKGKAKGCTGRPRGDQICTG